MSIVNILKLLSILSGFVNEENIKDDQSIEYSIGKQTFKFMSDLIEKYENTSIDNVFILFIKKMIFH